METIFPIISILRLTQRDAMGETPTALSEA